MNIAKMTGSSPRSDPGNLPDAQRPIVTLARDTSAPHYFPLHQHTRAQLVYASTGVLTVVTTQGTWVVPPQQAVWVPAGIKHEVRSPGPVSMRSLYIHPAFTQGLPGYCCVVTIIPLLRELILEAVSLANDYQPSGATSRLMHVILDKLQALKPTPLHLPLPQDPRIKIVSDALVNDPADDRDLEVWADSAGASSRTLARLFVKETGLTFGAWRERLRLLAAISRLGAGQSVTTVSYETGYHSPSAFIAMFKRTMGMPPGRYFRNPSTSPADVG